MEKNDVIFSKRQASIQSEVGPHKSSYGAWGSAMSGAPAKIEHLKYCHSDT